MPHQSSQPAAQPTLAVQLYTLRDFLKTPPEIAATLKRVRALGFTAVELAGLGNISAPDLAAMLTGEGLTCCSTHTPMERLRSEPQRVIDEHRLWSCPCTAVPIFRGEVDDFLGLAQELTVLASNFASAGLSIGYHNHSHELVKYRGRPLLDLMIEKIPRLWFEIDTYWIAYAGGDPAQWIGKLPARIPCVHLKDMTVDAAGQPLMAEVGEGNLNWPAILSACRQAAVRWHVVEQDTCQRDPFQSLAISLRNLQALGLE